MNPLTWTVDYFCCLRMIQRHCGPGLLQPMFSECIGMTSLSQALNLYAAPALLFPKQMKQVACCRCLSNPVCADRHKRRLRFGPLASFLDQVLLTSSRPMKLICQFFLLGMSLIPLRSLLPIPS